MGSDERPSIWWVRRDFRLDDNPALRSAIDDGEAVLPLFVLDPALLTSAGRARRAWLTAALHVLGGELRDAGGQGLSVLRGDPAAVVPRLAKSFDVKSVHVSADFGPYGRSRDEQVAQALGGHNIDCPGSGRRTRWHREPSGTVPESPFSCSARSIAPGWSIESRRHGRPGSAGIPKVLPTTPGSTISPEPTPPRTSPSRCTGATCIPEQSSTISLGAGREPRQPLVRQIAWRDFFAEALDRYAVVRSR